MSFQFTVSPDFTPDRLSGWYIFNTWLQKATGFPIHLEMFSDFHHQRDAIRNDQIDLIYANPYDAAMLVRDKGFEALARPYGKSDEALIAVSEESPFRTVEDLTDGARIATTEDPDVNLMGMIMLEPANLDRSNTKTINCDTYVLVAKELLKRNADAGIFLVEAYEGLSSLIRKQLRVLVSGQIQVVHHCLLMGPRLAQHKAELLRTLTTMADDPKGPGVLEALKFTHWEEVDHEEVEFMIDLMDTLAT